jgi:hypothetical protein
VSDTGIVVEHVEASEPFFTTKVTQGDRLGGIAIDVRDYDGASK